MLLTNDRTTPAAAVRPRCIPGFNLYDAIDGNAFALIAHFRLMARKARWIPHEIAAVVEEARSGDYNHLIDTLLEYEAD